ncbi:putative glucuronosyltransferase PGSIP7 [Glycine max]|nr:putative glucuronosyltransferase PGSIP7 [Glycine max]
MGRNAAAFLRWSTTMLLLLLGIVGLWHLPCTKATSEEEDGAKVVRVENMDNPYKHQDSFDKRFKLSLNKLYAWSLVDYDRIVMLDADNLFLQNTDELFQCGQFCAVFINPCVFHTGLSVLQPSMVVFKDMVHELQNGRENPDGAFQGFIASCCLISQCFIHLQMAPSLMEHIGFL